MMKQISLLFAGVWMVVITMAQTNTAPAKPSSALLKADVAVGRAAALNPADPKAAKVAQQAFGKDAKGSDAVTVTVEMGDAVKVSVNAKAKIVAFIAKILEGK